MKYPDFTICLNCLVANSRQDLRCFNIGSRSKRLWDEGIVECFKSKNFLHGIATTVPINCPSMEKLPNHSERTVKKNKHVCTKCSGDQPSFDENGIIICRYQEPYGYTSTCSENTNYCPYHLEHLVSQEEDNAEEEDL